MSDEDKQPLKRDPDGPPSYDDTHHASQSNFIPGSKSLLEPTTSASSSSQGTTYAGLVPQPPIVALDLDPPRFSSFTIHSWKTIRFVNFPHSVLEALDGVARLYYLNGVKWEYEHDQWSLVTGARACELSPLSNQFHEMEGA